MKTPLALLLLAALASGQAAAPEAAAPPAPATLTAEPFPLPGGEGGIDLDDLAFTPGLHQVVVPAGRTGRIDLIDPESRKVREIAGFRKDAPEGARHGGGTTSADEGQGYLFASDRTSLRLEVVDPAKGAIVAGAPLAGSPDYVRYVGATHEVWVTEPDKEGIEIFALSDATPPVPTHKAFLAIPGGPESLAIDNRAKVAYANLWKSSTMVIDLAAAKVTQTWPNGCLGSRGLALDPPRQRVFVGCAEGGADLLNAGHKGAIMSRFRFGEGTDIIAFNPTLGHLYVPVAKTGRMAIVGVSRDNNELRHLATVVTAVGAHCAVADDHAQVWVCDPQGGRLLLVRDTLPAVRGGAPTPSRPGSPAPVP